MSMRRKEVQVVGEDTDPVAAERIKRKRMMNASFFSRHSSVTPSESKEAWADVCWAKDCG